MARVQVAENAAKYLPLPPLYNVHNVVGLLALFSHALNVGGRLLRAMAASQVLS
jgi:hypothetical protein